MAHKYTDYDVRRILNIKRFHSGFEVYYDDSFGFGGEQHDFWEIVFVMDGELTVSADDRVYELSKNDIVFHRPMEMHNLRVPSGKRAHLFITSFEAEDEIMKFFEQGVFHLGQESKDELCRVVEYMRSYADGSHFDRSTPEYIKHWDDNIYYSQTVAGRLELLLLGMIDEAERVRPVRGGDAELYNRAVQLLEENIGEQLGVGEVARSLGVSLSKLNKLFASYAGIGVHKYHTGMRIRMAARLIEDGVALSEISDRLGFNNRNYFSQTFKREVGASPAEYRRAHTVR